MFERLKAYKKLKKSTEFIKGCIVTAEVTGNEEMLKMANETLKLNAELRKKILSKRKLAAEYNKRATKF